MQRSEHLFYDTGTNCTSFIEFYGGQQMLRLPNKIKAWIAFACDHDNTKENQEALPTALAASGTLAVACNDAFVTKAAMEQGIGELISEVLVGKTFETDSSHSWHDLLVRVLVMIRNMIGSEITADSEEELNKLMRENSFDTSQWPQTVVKFLLEIKLMEKFQTCVGKVPRHLLGEDCVDMIKEIAFMINSVISNE